MSEFGEDGPIVGSKPTTGYSEFSSYKPGTASSMLSQRFSAGRVRYFARAVEGGGELGVDRVLAEGIDGCDGAGRTATTCEVG